MGSRSSVRRFRMRHELVAYGPINRSLCIPFRCQFCFNFCSQPSNQSTTGIYMGWTRALSPSMRNQSASWSWAFWGTIASLSREPKPLKVAVRIWRFLKIPMNRLFHAEQVFRPQGNHSESARTHLSPAPCPCRSTFWVSEPRRKRSRCRPNARRTVPPIGNPSCQCAVPHVHRTKWQGVIHPLFERSAQRRLAPSASHR